MDNMKNGGKNKKIQAKKRVRAEKNSITDNAKLEKNVAKLEEDYKQFVKEHKQLMKDHEKIIKYFEMNTVKNTISRKAPR